jgi:hypothetical protein
MSPKLILISKNKIDILKDAHETNAPGSLHKVEFLKSGSGMAPQDMCEANPKHSPKNKGDKGENNLF